MLTKLQKMRAMEEAGDLYPEIYHLYNKCVLFIKEQVANHYCCKCSRANCLAIDAKNFLKSIEEE
jgi:L-lysine 2,3-aminomutase